MQPLSDLSDDQIADRIVTWAGRIAAAEAEQLQLIGEFDGREAWAGPGLLSCAHWLTWRTGLGPVAARERVRVARALRELPGIAGAFAAGGLSWSQARAITRVATADDEHTYVELCRNTTAAQLERVVRGVRRVHKAEQDDADPALAAHRLRSRTSYDADGSLVITLHVAAEVGAVVLAALEQIRTHLDASAQAPSSPTPAPAPASHIDGAASAEASAELLGTVTLTDAFVEMSRLALEQLAQTRPAASRRQRAGLAVQVDPLSGWARLPDGELLPPGSLAKTSALGQALKALPGRGGAPGLRPITASDLSRHDRGRTQRHPGQDLRDLLGVLDGERCRFPGCSRYRKLHAHHVTTWADGGATDLDNLVLLCGRHHTLVHQHGYQLTLHPDRRLTIRTTEGVRLLHHPALPWGDPAGIDPSGQIDAHTLPPQLVDRLDLRYVVSVMARQAA